MKFKHTFVRGAYTALVQSSNKMVRTFRVQLVASNSGRKYDNFIKIGQAVAPEDFVTLCKQITQAPVDAYFIGEYIQGAKQIVELAKFWRDGDSLEALDIDDASAVKLDGDTLTLLLTVRIFLFLGIYSSWAILINHEQSNNIEIGLGDRI